MLYFNESDDISVAGMQGNQTKLNHTDITHKYPTISPVTAQSCRIKRAQQQENFQDFMPTNYSIEVHCLDSFQQELSEKLSYVAVKRTVYRKIRLKKKKKGLSRTFSSSRPFSNSKPFSISFSTVAADNASWNNS